MSTKALGQEPLFWLVPKNDPAKRVVDDPINTQHVVHLPGAEGLVLQISLPVNEPPITRLATLGGKGDIAIQNGRVASIQCSFWMYGLEYPEVMLHQESKTEETVMHGSSAIDFDKETIGKRILLDSRTNLEIGFGGVNGQHWLFEVVWPENHGHRPSDDCLRKEQGIVDQGVNPKNEVITVGRRTTRIHGRQHPKIRYSMRSHLGQGAFGSVFRVCNVHTGDNIGMKTLPNKAWTADEWELLKIEIESLAQHKHVSSAPFPTPPGCMAVSSRILSS
jgi:hypothetical protein